MVVRVPREAFSGEGAAAKMLSADATSPSLGARLRPSLASDASESTFAAAPSLEIDPGIRSNTFSRWFQLSPSIQERRSLNQNVNRYSKPSKTRIPSITRIGAVPDDHLQSAEGDQTWSRFEGPTVPCLRMSFRGQSGHRDVPRLSAQGWGARREAPALASP